MKLQLRPVTVANRGDLDEIHPGEQEKYWVHTAWYWHQVSLENPDVTFRLIHLDGSKIAVGMVAYGPYYRDEAMTQKTEGIFEINHIVIDKHWQKRGIGKRVAHAVITMLSALPDCEFVYVAHHPDNEGSRLLFEKLGFRPSDLKNYDGDPIMVLQVL